jgi:hypothetical protein
MGDLRAERHLCSAVILKAVEDMRGEGTHPRRINAIAWLASSAATPWFDHSGVDQQFALDRAGWIDEARDVLAKFGPLPKHCRTCGHPMEDCKRCVRKGASCKHCDRPASKCKRCKRVLTRCKRCMAHDVCTSRRTTNELELIATVKEML